MRSREPGRDEVLRRVRHPADRGADRGSRGPQARDGALRGRGRFDRPRRAAGPRGAPGAYGPLLRDDAPDHRGARRHGREVHRRCCDGGLRHPERARGRCSPGGPGRGGDPRRAVRTQRPTRGGARVRHPLPYRRHHRRGRRGRRGKPDDIGHRGHGQHRRAARAGGAAGRDPDRAAHLLAGPRRRRGRGPRADRGQGQVVTGRRLSPARVHAGVEGRTRRLDTPLVGRARELARLDACLPPGDR